MEEFVESARVSTIVLAAGMSSRMGQPKPLVRVAGRTLLEQVLGALRRSRVGQVVVVLGHEADRIRREVPLGDATVVLNEDYANGMSTSLRAGLRVLDPRAKGFLVVLGDQPFVSPKTVDTLIDRWAVSGARILIPTFEGVRGNPVLLDRSLADDIETITGDQGCRGIFGDHPDEILEVPVPDPGILLDLDTKEQVDRVKEGLERGNPLASLVDEVVATRKLHHAQLATNWNRPKVRPRVEVLTLAEELRATDEPFALATVVRAVRPSSGRPGYKAIVRLNRELVGWVAGSCSEALVIAESLSAMRDGRPRLLRLAREVSRSPPEEGVVEYVNECHSGGSLDIYIEPFLPKPQLLLVGESPVVETLMAFGRLLGYRVVVLAPEAPPEAFSDADRVVRDLGMLEDLVTPNTYAVVATMGKYDEAAVEALARSPAPYVGLVASRRRAEAMMKELRQKGVPAKALHRIRNPAGLDLKAATPEEISLSIMAEITKVRRTSLPAELAVARQAPVGEVAAEAVDVVCGMKVDQNTPLRASHGGKTYYFCSEGCRSRFLESPDAFPR